MPEPPPPSYCTGGGDDRLPRPVRLYVAGRFIHADDPQSPPLYELSHAVGFLSDTARVVRIDRLDYSVKQLHGAPHVATRSRHMYDLTRPPPATSPTFPFHARATSRQSLCSFGIASFRPRTLSSARGYRVNRATRGPDHQLACQEALFTAVPARDDAVAFEWLDSQQRLLAREVGSGELESLLISAEMSSRARDALVSAWILRIWWDLAKATSRGIQWHHASRFTSHLDTDLSPYRF